METVLKSVWHYNLTYHLRKNDLTVHNLTAQAVPYHLARESICTPINRLIERLGETTMPRKKMSANTSYNITWKRVDMTPPEKEEFKAWVTKAEYDFAELLTHVLNDGDRITLKYNSQSNDYYCTIMGTDESHRNGGLGFSSFAKDADTALLVSLYKYVILLEGDLREAGSQEERGDFG